jgi:catechol 2,3-dioxygenase-like lactoylglutathione lyase family enzyme
MLWTEDLAGSVNFYTAVLGFSASEVNDEWGWASLSKDSVELMVSNPNEHTPYDKIGFTGTFYFSTDDVVRLWEELKDKALIC